MALHCQVDMLVFGPPSSPLIPQRRRKHATRALHPARFTTIIIETLRIPVITRTGEILVATTHTRW